MATKPLTMDIPDRVWDIDPAQLRSMGVQDDYDIEVQANAERDWDARACADLARFHGLSSEDIDKIRDALRERRRQVWGQYFKP